MAEPPANKPFRDFKIKEADGRLVEEAAVPGGSLMVPEPQVSLSEGQIALAEADSSDSKQTDPDNREIFKSEFNGHSSKLHRDTEYRGLLRHQLIVGGSVLFTLSLFVFSLLDLNSLVKTTGFIDQAGHITANLKRPRLSPEMAYVDDLPSEGLFRVRESSWNSNRFGLVDLTGKTVLPPSFVELGPFSEGLAYAQKAATNGHKLVGYIDKTGQFVIPAIYDECSSFSDGTAIAHAKGNTLLLDKKGKILFQTNHSNQKADEVGAADDAEMVGAPVEYGPTTTALLDPKETAPSGQSLGRYDGDRLHTGTKHNVRLDNGYRGLLDNKGNWFIKPEYNSITSALDDVNLGYSISDASITNYQPNTGIDRSGSPEPTAYIVEKTQLFGVIGADGKQILKPEYTRILSYQNGHAAVLVNGKYGFVDNAGKFVIKPEYDYVTAFDKIIAVKRDKDWSFIDSSGKPIGGPVVDGIVHSGRGLWQSGGMGAVLKGGKIGFLNAQGQFALTPKYVWALAFSHGLTPVYDGTFWHYINKSGQQVSPNFGMANSLGFTGSEVVLPGPLYPFVQFNNIENFNGTVNEWKKAVDKPSVTPEPTITPKSINDLR